MPVTDGPTTAPALASSTPRISTTPSSTSASPAPPPNHYDSTSASDRYMSLPTPASLIASDARTARKLTEEYNNRCAPERLPQPFTFSPPMSSSEATSRPRSTTSADATAVQGTPSPPPPPSSPTSMEAVLQAFTSTLATSRLPTFNLKPFKGDMAYAFSPPSDPAYSTLNDFLLHFEAIYTSAKEPRSEWPYRMLQHLEGSALAAVQTEFRRRRNSGLPISFEEISAFMHQRFLLADSPRALRDAIRALKQGSGAISAYIDEHSRLMSFVDFPDADYYVDIFVEGLNPTLAKIARTFISNRISNNAIQPSLEQIKRHLLASHVSELYRPQELASRSAPIGGKSVSFLASSAAQDHESMLALAAASGYLSQPRPPQAPTPHHNRYQRDRGRQSPSSSADRFTAPPRDPSLLCFNCGRPGHFSRQCTAPMSVETAERRRHEQFTSGSNRTEITSPRRMDPPLHPPMPGPPHRDQQQAQPPPASHPSSGHTAFFVGGISTLTQAPQSHQGPIIEPLPAKPSIVEERPSIVKEPPIAEPSFMPEVTPVSMPAVSVPIRLNSLIRLEVELSHSPASSPLALAAVVDTGCTHSILATAAYVQMSGSEQITLEPCAPITVADNQVVYPLGRTPPILVSPIGSGPPAHVRFVVLDEMAVPILLGLDWGSLTNATANMASRAVSFGPIPTPPLPLPPAAIPPDICNGDQSEAASFLASAQPSASKPRPPAQVPVSAMSPEAFREFVLNPASGIDLPKDQSTRAKLVDVIVEFQDVFATAIEDIQQPALLPPFPINVVPLSQPLKAPYRARHAASQVKAIDNQVDVWFQAGIIERSETCHLNSLLTVPKPDGSDRVCLDPRTLNAATHPDSSVTPTCRSTIDSLVGSSVFSSVDLFQGYLQVELEPESRKYTGFATTHGTWQFKRLPFGLKNACAAFNARLRTMERNNGLSEFVAGFFDDSTVHSKSVDDHIQHLRALFAVFRKYRLKVNLRKCHFFKELLQVLGHCVSAQGVSVNPDKIRAIRELPVPTTLAELLHLLGMANYYRRFIKNFAEIARPLHALSTAKAQFQWNCDCQQAWLTIKELLTSAPVLALPDPSRPFILHVDASNYAIGAVLSQLPLVPSTDPSDVTKPVSKPVPRPNAYFSMQLTPPQTRWPTIEKEQFAMVSAVHHFYEYIGTNHCDVYTDHAALIYLLGAKDLMGRLVRWQMYLQQFDLTIFHRPGKENANADALSRLPAVAPANPAEEFDGIPCFLVSTATPMSGTEPEPCLMVLRPRRSRPSAPMVGPAAITSNLSPSAVVSPTSGSLQPDAPALSSVPLAQSLPTIPTPLSPVGPAAIAAKDVATSPTVEPAALGPGVSSPLKVPALGVPDPTASASLSEGPKVSTSPVSVLPDRSFQPPVVYPHLSSDIYDHHDLAFFVLNGRHDPTSNSSRNAQRRVEREAVYYRFLPDQESPPFLYHPPVEDRRHRRAARPSPRPSTPDPTRPASAVAAADPADPEADEHALPSEPSVPAEPRPPDPSPRSHPFAGLRGRVFLLRPGAHPLVVPLPAQRSELIARVHSLGHFQFASTLHSLLDRYRFWWYRMSHDVAVAVQSCPSCTRFDRVIAPEHPARSLEVPGVFHRVAMDLVLGLPVTERGHNGILVISEYLTKFPVVYPIKSKTAVETAAHLWSYMCTYGPPRELLSDQGREFVNSTVAALSSITGTVRRLTSPYHPRTDGHVERYNQTLIDSLEKHCHDKPEDWDLHLDSVVFAYRIRVHSATGHSPFELLYGRTANLHYAFTDSPLDVSLSFLESLGNRVEEIRHLSEKLWPSTVDSIRDAQVGYRQYQDARNAPSSLHASSLPVGTVVYVRIKLQRKKLQPRFLGPYKVLSVNDSGNYTLSNKKGQPLSRSYPISQLKIIPDLVSTKVWEQACAGNVFITDRIVDHMIENNTTYYLVHWRDFDDEFDSWHSESSLNNTDIISAYWSSQSSSHAIPAPVVSSASSS